MEGAAGKQGQFYLRYNASNLASDFLSVIATKSSKTFGGVLGGVENGAKMLQTTKKELFQSSHLAEIIDCFDQMCTTIEEQEKLIQD